MSTANPKKEPFYYDASHWTLLVEFTTHANTGKKARFGIKPESVCSVTPYYGKGEGCTIWMKETSVTCDCSAEIARQRINMELDAGKHRHNTHHKNLLIDLAILKSKHRKLIKESA